MLGQIFQPVLEQMRAVSGKDMGVLNNSGTVVACVGERLSEELAFDAVMNNTNNGRPFVLSAYTFVAFGMRNMMDYVVYVRGTDAESQRLSLLLSVSLSNLQIYCGDKYDKTNYLKSVLLGNVLPGDVYLHAAELQIDMEIPRLVYIIQLQEPADISLQHILQNLFPENDFVIGIDNLNVVLIKSLPVNYNRDFINKIAKNIVETVNSELMLQIYVGVGTPTESIYDIARSYSEAQIALEIGRVFEGDQYILSYDALGIGRLIYQLPSKLCELFLDEIFKKESIDVLDEETLQTIYKFFENNLNVSETSRQLFVHRNTLVYRLDKIERLTGLDLRKFDDAVIFKVAILVNKYLRANSAKF
ncbi:MAG: PucR family transcriptional regulator [Ruminococcaceae bacterium]|nr:PucR family transcriptional regulator [Oscillospiraceae bacterium]